MGVQKRWTWTRRGYVVRADRHGVADGRRKDVSAVCSLSYHLPRDAVAFGAMRPVFLDDDGTTQMGMLGTKVGTRGRGDERPIEMSFRGTLRGGVRERILGHYLSMGKSTWKKLGPAIGRAGVAESVHVA